jgi:hypothetical protein
LISKETITGKSDDTSLGDHKLYAKIFVKRLAIYLKNLVKELPNIDIPIGRNATTKYSSILLVSPVAVFSLWTFN